MSAKTRKLLIIGAVIIGAYVLWRAKGADIKAAIKNVAGKSAKS